MLVSTSTTGCLLALLSQYVQLFENIGDGRNNAWQRVFEDFQKYLEISFEKTLIYPHKTQ